MTKYAKAIYEIVEASRSHMTADQIFETLRKRYPSVVLATVYNNLNKLWEEGYIRKVAVEGQPDRYDRTERHDHLMCKVCGRLQDLELPDLIGQLQQQVDVPVLAYDLKLLYICEDCRNTHDEK